MNTASDYTEFLDWLQQHHIEAMLQVMESDDLRQAARQLGLDIPESASRAEVVRALRSERADELAATVASQVLQSAGALGTESENDAIDRFLGSLTPVQMDQLADRLGVEFDDRSGLDDKIRILRGEKDWELAQLTRPASIGRLHLDMETLTARVAERMDGCQTRLSDLEDAVDERLRPIDKFNTFFGSTKKLVIAGTTLLGLLGVPVWQYWSSLTNLEDAGVLAGSAEKKMKEVDSAMQHANVVLGQAEARSKQAAEELTSIQEFSSSARAGFGNVADSFGAILQRQVIDELIATIEEIDVYSELSPGTRAQINRSIQVIDDVRKVITFSLEDSDSGGDAEIRVRLRREAELLGKLENLARSILSLGGGEVRSRSGLLAMLEYESSGTDDILRIDRIQRSVQFLIGMLHLRKAGRSPRDLDLADEWLTQVVHADPNLPAPYIFRIKIHRLRWKQAESDEARDQHVRHADEDFEQAVKLCRRLGEWKLYVLAHNNYAYLRLYTARWAWNHGDRQRARNILSDTQSNVLDPVISDGDLAPILDTTVADFHAQQLAFTLDELPDNAELSAEQLEEFRGRCFRAIDAVRRSVDNGFTGYRKYDRQSILAEAPHFKALDRVDEALKRAGMQSTDLPLMEQLFQAMQFEEN